MEIRHLIYFKTVAEELHFRNAALKLFISQPPLSRQIRELEEELGALLFERSNKRVKLTPAGEYFKMRTDDLLAQLNETKQVVRQIHENLSGELRIGYISSTYHAYMFDTLKEMRMKFPFLNIKLFEVPTIKQVKALEEGKLDVGIMRAPVNSEQLHVVTLFNDPFVVAISGTKAKNLENCDLGTYLSQQDFIFFNQDYAPVYYQKMIEICQRMGFNPMITHEANTVHSILRLVAHGAGVSILPATVSEQFPELDLHYVDLRHLPIGTEVVLAHRQLENKAVDWFVNTYTTLFTPKQLS